MPSAIITTAASPESAQWQVGLETVGVEIVGRAENSDLLQSAIRTASDLIVCFDNHPDDALFSSTSAVSRSAPRPVIVFTTDPDAEKIEQATQSGVHAYVINGYGLHRLRSVIHVSEVVLSDVDRLTDAYERSIQMLFG